MGSLPRTASGIPSSKMPFIRACCATNAEIFMPGQPGASRAHRLGGSNKPPPCWGTTSPWRGRSNCLHYFELAGDHAASVFANDEAVASYRRALEVLGTAAAEMMTEAVQLWLKLGTLFWRLGGYEEGRAAVQEAAKLAPTTSELLGAKAYRWLGQLEVEAGRDEEAAAALDTADRLLGTFSDESSNEWVALWLDVQFTRSQLHKERNESQLQASVLERMRPVVDARAGRSEKPSSERSW